MLPSNTAAGNSPKTKLIYCHECPDIPCEKLAHFEKRYTERYPTSLIGNLSEIEKKGMAQFLQHQENLFKCYNCGEVNSCFMTANAISAAKKCYSDFDAYAHR